MGKTTDLNAAFGIAIRKLRTDQKLTQEQLGFEAGLRRTYISSLELGDKQPSLMTVQKLSSAFGIPMTRLVQLTEKELQKL